MTLRRSLVLAIALTSGLGLAVELAHAFAPSPLGEVLLPELSLSGEGNLPTWLSAVLLFACAIAAGTIAQGHARPGVAVYASDRESSDAALQIANLLQRADDPARRGWWGVACVFGYASLDEVAQLHEHLGGHLELPGVLYFDWILPATGIVAVLALVFLPFLRALAPTTRRRLVIAGAVYLGGAIAMELPLGWWTDRHGIDNLGYGLIDWVEETLEMTGAAMALYALRRHEEVA